MSPESTGTVSTLTAALTTGAVSVIELTAPLSSATPVLQLPPEMAATPPFRLDELSKYDERGTAWYHNEIHTGEHVGTHFDAPLHWVTGAEFEDVATAPVSRLIAPAAVIDKTAEATADPDFLLRREDVQEWQRANGDLPAGWLLLRTGWAARSHDQTLFLNADDTGSHTPGVDPACARWLAEETPILGFGVETVGTDAGQAFRFEPAFPVHTHLLGAGKYGITQLQNLHLLPPTGALLIVAPLRIVGGSGSPARILALVDTHGAH
ncbi:cyclase family protein [Amycolatopsis rhabdoformis]|uniref:Cyclase family protein n=1 Tax=Amycolatopsis rhabdoformis TaxID=1448059 RepID=A0ABZ1HV13_9PSEU|nr:cyclase family protein [Amycolatopsis rhabdoformis]WSE26174.1 cyclase family protein [Amycolatopsis rhabdoformis]